MTSLKKKKKISKTATFKKVTLEMVKIGRKNLVIFFLIIATRLI